jgi:hypothetical protein
MYPSTINHNNSYATYNYQYNEHMSAINKKWPYLEAKDYHNFNSIS